MNRVFVITVCRNAAQRIEQTMLSVLGQTYGNLSYIVIDGGSDDGTERIVGKYASRLSYWCSEPDGGIYDAMNKGLRIARNLTEAGESAWVNFMNAGDCFSDAEVVSDFFSGSAHYPQGVQVLAGGYHMVDGRNGRKELFQAGDADCLPAWMPFCHQATFMRLDRCRFDTRFKISADYHLFYNLYFTEGRDAFLCKDRTVADFLMDDSTTYSNLRAVRRENLIIKSKRIDWFWIKECAKWLLHLN